jgi:hypothetical protein
VPGAGVVVEVLAPWGAPGSVAVSS